MAFKDLPAFCRVAATLKPTDDSDIKIEVWLPASGWNGKFQAVGNGGWAGVISYGAMAEALHDGYATSSTDTGHVGGSGSFALGSSRKADRLRISLRVHEMTVKSKSIIDAFYGIRAADVLLERMFHRRPARAEGSAAISRRLRRHHRRRPANPRTHLSSWQIWLAQGDLKDPHNYIPPGQVSRDSSGRAQACDALDGLKDGLMRIPLAATSIPDDRMQGAETAHLPYRRPQMEAAKRMSPSRNPRTGEEIYLQRWSPAAELGWGTLARGPQPFSAATDHFKYVVFKDPDWDWKTLNLDSDVALADKIDTKPSTPPIANIKAVLRGRGKLLLYHGWADQNVAAARHRQLLQDASSIPWAAKPRRRIPFGSSWLLAWDTAAAAKDPNTFDMMSAITAWRENGQRARANYRLARRSHTSSMRLSSGGQIQRIWQHR